MATTNKKCNPPRADGGFIMMPYCVFDDPKFVALSAVEKVILFLLIRRHNGKNNGAIPLGVREAAKLCGCGQATACRALQALEQAGFITPVYKGHMTGLAGCNIATRWRLNFIHYKE